MSNFKKKWHRQVINPDLPDTNSVLGSMVIYCMCDQHGLLEAKILTVPHIQEPVSCFTVAYKYMMLEMQPAFSFDFMIIYMYAGVDELHVDSQLFGSFTLKASLHRDSAEDICRKVSDCTKVSTAYMQLYARKGLEPLDIYTELRDGDRITMVLKNPAMHIGIYTAEYGKKSYNMLQPQTDEGIAKFFSILRYLCLKKKETVNFQSLLALVKRLTNCPPIVYALSVLYENSCLSLSCWVALIEGIYQFFKSWLGTFLESMLWFVSDHLSVIGSFHSKSLH